MPAISIVMPLYNDEEWVGRAIASCLAQTLTDIEVVCVDDASTDGTPTVVRDYASRDPRVRLIELDENQSAYQARRVGVAAAAAARVLFLDGDDELAPDAAKLALRAVKTVDADVVGFGVELRTLDGRGAPRFERSLQPPQQTLAGADIVRELFPPGKPAQGHLWRYMWKTDLLRHAYAGSSAHSRFYRANDLPITFVALAAAKRYVAIPEKLYRYNFGRGTSGQAILDTEGFKFYLSALDSFASAETLARNLAASTEDPSPILDSFESARRSIIGNLLRQIAERAITDVQPQCLELLRARINDDALLLRSCLEFHPAALTLIVPMLTDSVPAPRDIEHVLITTGNLRAGGVQAVAVAQAQELVQRGFRVTLALFDPAPSAYDLPPDVEVVYVPGSRLDVERFDRWTELVREREVDIVIDHHVLYNRRWHLQALAARIAGVPTIGWLHSFALRSLADSKGGTSFLLQYMPLLRTVVVLSAADVAFWKTQGVENVAYLPNPASFPGLKARSSPRTLDGGRIELAWWGRLQQATKQVSDLIGIAVELKTLAVDFHMTIIGPDSDDLTAEALRSAAEDAGVSDEITLTGALHGRELERAIERSEMFVSTSIIEGYQLTIVEAQAHGIPVVMYELPWLPTVVGNEGVVAVPQGDKHRIADAIAKITSVPGDYERLSAASIASAKRALDNDIGALYVQLLNQELPAEYSPEPTKDDVALLLTWSVFYAERNARSARRAAARHLQTQKDLKRVGRKLAQIQEGPSFRIGRMLTFVPRNARRVLKRLIGR